MMIYIKRYITNNGISTKDFKLGFSGYLEITKDLPGPMELVMDINRCDLLMKGCEKYEKFSIGGMCTKFKAKKLTEPTFVKKR